MQVATTVPQWSLTFGNCQKPKHHLFLLWECCSWPLSLEVNRALWFPRRNTEHKGSHLKMKKLSSYTDLYAKTGGVLQYTVTLMGIVWVSFILFLIYVSITNAGQIHHPCFFFCKYFFFFSIRIQHFIYDAWQISIAGILCAIIFSRVKGNRISLIDFKYNSWIYLILLTGYQCCTCFADVQEFNSDGNTILCYHVMLSLKDDLTKTAEVVCAFIIY